MSQYLLIAHLKEKGIFIANVYTLKNKRFFWVIAIRIGLQGM